MLTFQVFFLMLPQQLSSVLQHPTVDTDVPRPRPFPSWFRKIVLSDNRSAKELAKCYKIHESTVQRWRHKFQTTGSLEPAGHSTGRPRRLSDKELALLRFYKEQYPGWDNSVFPFKDTYRST
jgi:hypothetical protein